MANLPPLTSRIARGAEGGGEFERLMNQLLLRFADRHDFEYEPTGGAGGDGGVDGLARRGGVPGFEGPVAFQFKWLCGAIHKGSNSQKITDALNRAAEIQVNKFSHWVLVTPHDLTPSEKAWLLEQSPRKELTVHHWGQARLEGLLRDYCPSLMARYYPHEAKPFLANYDGHDFREFATEYRKKVAIVNRRLRTIGLPPETLREQDAGSDIGLRNIFVPQRFLPDKGGDQSVPLAQLLKASRSCMLLGDPGMGKTTVLCFVALLFCGEAELEDFSPSANVVPLLIPLRDFLRLKQEKPDLEFLEYLAHRARGDLALPHAHPAFFEAALRMGEAVILVDGLDEAGADASRLRISNMIQAFQAEFPHCPCWATSRVYGYTRDVRLPADEFAHHHVARLDEPQIDDFVTRWYTIQYPNNARERDERVKSLQHAIKHTPSVQRLAGNPLLLTLMAFIHHGQRSLPQDRGELYEQCVQMLLKTWQEAKREGQVAIGHGDGNHPFEKIGLHVSTQKDYLAHLAMSAQESIQAAGEDEGRGLIRRDDALNCLAQRHLTFSRRRRPEMQLAEAREEMEHFLDYISDRTGLLIDKGGGQLSFIHLSFQEYLAAWLVCCDAASEKDQREFFESKLGQAAWEEVLLLRLYIMLRLPGGGGEGLFDAVVSGLLRKLERDGQQAGWLTLARAVRDNLDFSASDRKAIVGETLSYWINSIFRKAVSFGSESVLRFDDAWFSVIEEICLFSPQAQRELGELLELRSQFAQFPSKAINWLQDVGIRIESQPAEASPPAREDVAWKAAIVMGEWLQGLMRREVAVPTEMTNFFHQCVFQAIEQEIAVKDRQTWGVALGRLGDPRVELNLRVSTDANEHPAYVQIPAGQYVVGEDNRQITIDQPFWLSKYPATNAQYALFVEDGGYAKREFWSDGGWQWVQDKKTSKPIFWRDKIFNAPNQPVVGVSWWEAEAFCRWAGGSLPTAQQWEAAARGPEGFEFPWGDDWEDGICNSREAGLDGTSAVGIFPRSTSAAFGLVDMAGNVWEWCRDEYGATRRVYRGGGWLFGAGDCRSAYRFGGSPGGRGDSLGFRLAAVPPSQQARNKSQRAEPGT